MESNRKVVVVPGTVHMLMDLSRLIVQIAILVFLILLVVQCSNLKTMVNVMRDIRNILEALAPCIQSMCPPIA